jgi:hypothetical protein
MNYKKTLFYSLGFIALIIAIFSYLNINLTNENIIKAQSKNSSFQWNSADGVIAAKIKETIKSDGSVDEPLDESLRKFLAFDGWNKLKGVLLQKPLKIGGDLDKIALDYLLDTTKSRKEKMVGLWVLYRDLPSASEERRLVIDLLKQFNPYEYLPDIKKATLATQDDFEFAAMARVLKSAAYSPDPTTNREYEYAAQAQAMAKQFFYEQSRSPAFADNRAVMLQSYNHLTSTDEINTFIRNEAETLDQLPLNERLEFLLQVAIRDSSTQVSQLPTLLQRIAQLPNDQAALRKRLNAIVMLWLSNGLPAAPVAATLANYLAALEPALPANASLTVDIVTDYGAWGKAMLSCKLAARGVVRMDAATKASAQAQQVLEFAQQPLKQSVLLFFVEPGALVALKSSAVKAQLHIYSNQLGAEANPVPKQYVDEAMRLLSL